MNQLFLHCRPGFEKECAAEISDLASSLGAYGYCKTSDNSAYVLFHCPDAQALEQLIRHIPFRKLVFVRQWFLAMDLITDLPVTDRLSSLLDAARQLPPVSELVVETVDTNTGKELSTLGKKFSVPFTKALEVNGCLVRRSDWRLHLVFMTGTQAYLGLSPIRNSSTWPMGIPRLRLPKEAPSRATLKLEEAWHHFIPAEEWDFRLAPGMKAVDLGAAPGGWTWQLVQRSIYVEAVDNGPMDKDLMESGLVEHMLSDGFVYEPRKPVDWLVCDIVDKPARVAAMVTRWFAKGLCREAVFNLKLPMKQRYAEVQKLRERIVSELESLGMKVSLEFKQLYHDREEVTGHLRILR